MTEGRMEGGWGCDSGRALRGGSPLWLSCRARAAAELPPTSAMPLRGLVPERSEGMGERSEPQKGPKGAGVRGCSRKRADRANRPRRPQKKTSPAGGKVLTLVFENPLTFAANLTLHCKGSTILSNLQEITLKRWLFFCLWGFGLVVRLFFFRTAVRGVFFIFAAWSCH